MGKKENKVHKTIKKIKISENTTSEMNSLLKPTNPSLKKKPAKIKKVEGEEKVSQINPQLLDPNNTNEPPVAISNTAQKKQTTSINKIHTTKIDLSKAIPIQNLKPTQNQLNNRQNEALIRPFNNARLNPIQQKILQLKQTLTDNAQQAVIQTRKIQETQTIQKAQRNQQELITNLNKSKQPLNQQNNTRTTFNNAIQTALKNAEQKIAPALSKEKMDEKKISYNTIFNSKPKNS